MSKKTQKSIQIQVPETQIDGKYVNLFMINFSENEFIIDFIYLIPNSNRAKVQARVILSPKNAKKFLRLLNSNLKKFEEMFGELIILDELPNVPKEMQ